MFDIGPTELLLIVVVAVIVIGPKDLPLALRTAGKWIGKVRKVLREHPEGGPPGTEQTGAYPAGPITEAAPEPASAESRAATVDGVEEYGEMPVSGGKGNQP